eukprot:gene8473-11455_t
MSLAPSQRRSNSLTKKQVSILASNERRKATRSILNQINNKNIDSDDENYEPVKVTSEMIQERLIRSHIDRIQSFLPKYNKRGNFNNGNNPSFRKLNRGYFRQVMKSIPYAPLKRDVSWLALHYQDSNSNLSLSEELEMFSSYVSLKKHEKDARESLLLDIQETIKSKLPDCVIQLFGSYSVGLSTFLSDIDISILEVGVSDDENNNNDNNNNNNKRNSDKMVRTESQLSRIKPQNSNTSIQSTDVNEDMPIEIQWTIDTSTSVDFVVSQQHEKNMRASESFEDTGINNNNNDPNSLYKFSVELEKGIKTNIKKYNVKQTKIEVKIDDENEDNSSVSDAESISKYERTVNSKKSNNNNKSSILQQKSDDLVNGNLYNNNNDDAMDENDSQIEQFETEAMINDHDQSSDIYCSDEEDNYSDHVDEDQYALARHHQSTNMSIVPSTTNTAIISTSNNNKSKVVLSSDIDINYIDDNNEHTLVNISDSVKKRKYSDANGLDSKNNNKEKNDDNNQNDNNPEIIEIIDDDSGDDYEDIEDDNPDNEDDLNEDNEVDGEDEIDFTTNGFEFLPFGNKFMDNSLDQAQAVERAKETQRKSLEVLRSIFPHVKYMDWVQTIELRSKAKVPIINLVHRNGIECDISIGIPAKDTSVILQSLITLCGKSLKILSNFLKVFLYQYELDKPFTGGLGSYKLYVMCAYHIQNNLKFLNNNNNNNNNNKPKSNTADEVSSPNYGCLLDTPLLAKERVKHSNQCQNCPFISSDQREKIANDILQMITKHIRNILPNAQMNISLNDIKKYSLPLLARLRSYESTNGLRNHLLNHNNHNNHNNIDNNSNKRIKGIPRGVVDSRGYHNHNHHTE